MTCRVTVKMNPDSVRHLTIANMLCQLWARGYNSMVMIESVQFKNFKVLRNAELPLGRFTLIVGPNSSGKSTVLQALKMAGSPSQYSYGQIVTAGSGATTVEIIINWTGKCKTLHLWTPGGAGGMRFINSQGSPSPNSDQQRAIQQWLNGVSIYSLDPKQIAQAMPLMPQAELQPEGAYLVIVLDRLRDQYPERFDLLNEALGQWVPEFDRILFETPQGGYRAFLLRTRKGHHKIPAAELSHGTLLALAMLTLAYLPDPPSVVCLEDPDRGLHPRLLRDVQDALYRLAYPENFGESRKPVQVIATTHSPYFLDLYRDHPEEVVIAEKTDQGTQFKRLSDHPHLDEILRDSHLGEIWYTGILGGVPAHA
jgi:predicted ATPase